MPNSQPSPSSHSVATESLVADVLKGQPEMCGIAGYSLSASSRVERTLAAQALLAGIAERGADAVGYAYVTPAGEIAIHKQRSGASALLDQVVLSTSAKRGSGSRARLHQGSPADRGEQPSDPSRLGGRCPQRDHLQRRRADGLDTASSARSLR
mgnify:CR=1 FL=1